MAEINGRDVSIAVLAAKIDSMREDLSGIIRRLEDHDMRIRKAEVEIAGCKQSIGIVQAAQAAFTLVASSIAGWIGSRP